jgi:ArsR family transcriptional regulator
VTELAASLNVPQSTISRHLKILRERNLVGGQRSGQGIAYSLVDQRVIQALDLLRAVLNEQFTAQASLALRALNQTVAIEKD